MSLVATSILLWKAALPMSAPKETQQGAEARSVARKEIAEAYDQWNKARVAYDRDQFDKMMTPDFSAQLFDQKVDRKAFLEMISQKPTGFGLARFESTILTLNKKGDDWFAVITEKLEAQGTGPDGKARNAYSFWITRDGWRKVGDKWMVISTEAIGAESWPMKPPIKGW